MLEEVDESLFPTSPVAPTNTGKWAVTSTYDVYMVDTLKGDDEKPARDNSRRKSSRKKSKRETGQAPMETRMHPNSQLPVMEGETPNNTMPKRIHSESQARSTPITPRMITTWTMMTTPWKRSIALRVITSLSQKTHGSSKNTGTSF
jgi:hypothetical protein